MNRSVPPLLSFSFSISINRIYHFRYALDFHWWHSTTHQTDTTQTTLTYTHVARIHPNTSRSSIIDDEIEPIYTIGCNRQRFSITSSCLIGSILILLHLLRHGLGRVCETRIEWKNATTVTVNRYHTTVGAEKTISANYLLFCCCYSFTRLSPYTVFYFSHAARVPNNFCPTITFVYPHSQ